MKVAISLAVILSLGCVSASPTPFTSSVAASSASAVSSSSSSSAFSSSSSYNFYAKDVCSSVGYDIRDYLSTSIFDELEQQFLQKKCELLSSYSVYPRDIGYELDSYSPDSLVYDIIFVGGGPAGLSALPILAASGKKILIIDAGYLPPAVCDSLYYRHSLYESSYVNAFDAYINGVDVRRKIYTAKLFGGLSTLDTNCWNIGSKYLYDQLAQYNDEFAWEKVYSHYQSLEGYKSYSKSVSVSKSTTSTSSSSSSSISSGCGSSSSSSSSSTTTTTSTYTYSSTGTYSIFNSYAENYLTSTISSVFNELGYSNNPNPFDLTPGYTILPILGDIDRPSLFPYTVFKNLGKLSNVDLSLGTTVNKIIFNGPIATGVEVTTITGQVKTVLATEQVILSTGPVNTYKLLFNSGIGPQDLLTQFNIPVNVPIPSLGQSLRYSPIYPGIVLKFPRGYLVDNCDSDARNLAYAFGDYHLSATTQLAYYRAYLATAGSKTANISLKFHAYSYSTSRIFQSAIRSYFQYDSYTQEYLTSLIEEYDILIVSLQLLNPFSTGSIGYKNSLDTLDINLGFYSDERDLLAMSEAIEQVRTIATTQAFSSLSAEIVQLPLQNVNYDYFSAEFNKQSILYNSIPSLYPAGGFSIGNTYENAVVDKALRFIGCKNLRLFSPCISPVPLHSDSIAFSTYLGVYGAEVIMNEYNGVVYDTISISNTGISASSTSIESSSYSASSRDIDISSSSISGSNIVGSGLTGAVSEISSSSTDINASSTSLSSSNSVYNANGISSDISSSLSSSEYAAAQSTYEASQSSYEASQYSANNSSSSIVAGAGAVSNSVSSSSQSYQAESESSASSASYIAGNASSQYLSSQAEYEASSYQASAASTSSSTSGVVF